jgi:TonB family protein
MGMSQEKIKDIWSSKVKQTMEYMHKLHPEISSEQWAGLEQILMSDKARESTFVQIVSVFKRHFCAGDIKQYMAFDGSPAGRKFHAEMPIVIDEWWKAARDCAVRMGAEVGEPKQGSTAGEPAGPSAPSAATPTPQSNPQASGTKRIQVTQGVSQGLLIHKVQPTYPPLARQARVQGTVILQALIDKDGTIEKLELVSGHPMLVPAAIDAVKQWQYRPYIYEGQPVQVETTINVNFMLAGPEQSGATGKAGEQQQAQASHGQNQQMAQPQPKFPMPSPGSSIKQAEVRAGVAAGSNLTVLSDTQGVDFGPYLSKVVDAVRRNWYLLIPEEAKAPEMKRGKLAIEFVILPDGKVAAMKLVSPSGDVSLDRAAWGGITASNPFAPLPEDFHGPYLALRFRFYYNPEKGDLEGAPSTATY